MRKAERRHQLFQRRVGRVLVQLVLRKAGAERLGGELAAVLVEQDAVGEQGFLRQIEGVMGVDGPVFLRREHQRAVIGPAPGTGHSGFEHNAVGDRLAYRRQGGDGLGKTHLQVIHSRGLLGVVGQVRFVQRIAHGVRLRQVGVPVPAIETGSGQQHQAHCAGARLAWISTGFVAQVRQAMADGTQPERRMPLAEHGTHHSH